RCGHEGCENGQDEGEERGVCLGGWLGHSGLPGGSGGGVGGVRSGSACCGGRHCGWFATGVVRSLGWPSQRLIACSFGRTWAIGGGGSHGGRRAVMGSG